MKTGFPLRWAVASAAAVVVSLGFVLGGADPAPTPKPVARLQPTPKPAEAKTLTNQGITKIAGKGLAQPVIDAAWGNMTFTVDPIASSLRSGADHAKDVGLLDAATKLDGLYDLTLLNKVLKAEHKPEVHS